MAEAGFYYDAAAKGFGNLVALLQKVLAAGQRAVVVAANEQTARELDDRLWRVERFLPHSMGGDEHASRQPIWLDTEPTAPNGAQTAIFYHTSGGEGDFAKRLFLVAADDAARCAEAKARWRKLQKAGVQPVRGFNRSGGSWRELEAPL